MKKKIIILFFVLTLLQTDLYSQNNDSTFSIANWGVSLNTGYSPYGTGISLHKNVSNNLNLESSLGVDLAFIPFLGFGPASNEYLIGIGGNYYIFERSNFALNFSSFLHINPTTEENIIGDKRYLSFASYLGYIPRSSGAFPLFLKLGFNYDLKKSIGNRKMEFNLAFGLLITW